MEMLLKKLMMINGFHLYKQASELPNVNYIGYRPNEYILEICKIIISLLTLVYGKKHLVYLLLNACPLVYILL